VTNDNDNDGVALTSIRHPVNKTGRRKRINPSSLETIEIEIDAPELSDEQREALRVDPE